MNEIEFIGSLGMPPTRYDEIFRMVSTGKLEPEKVVSETIGLEDVSDKLEAMTDFETVGVPVVDNFWDLNSALRARRSRALGKI